MGEMADRGHGRYLWVWALALVCACGGDETAVPPASADTQGDHLEEAGGELSGEEMLQQVEAIGTRDLPGLSEPVEVIFTELGVPHIYGRNRPDVGRTLGFLLGRDRYFVMDLQRRLGLGRLTELLGDSTLEMDQEMRGMGMAYVADRLLSNLSPEMGAYLDAFAEGVNSYIAEVAAGTLPPPSELDAAYALLGADSVADLMHPWDRRSVAGMVSVVLYETTYEGGDVGRAAKAQNLKSIYSGDGHQEALRRSGFLEDVAYEHRALFDAHSTTGFGVTGNGPVEVAPGEDRAANPDDAQRRQGNPGDLPAEMIARLSLKLDRQKVRLLRDEMKGFGSNAWAVAGSASEDGSSLVAGDGHLPLTVPPLMYQVGLDTEVLGGGNIHQLGLLLTGLPVLAVGTNGGVAWSQVNPVTDTTDWYLEEITLTDEGEPGASMFQGEWRDLERHEEAYVVADVALLDSVGRTETWARWVTFDGRWIADVEGRPASPDEELAPGETVVDLQGTRIVPGDSDGDGVITAISFDYAAFDATSYMDTLDALGLAEDVSQFQEATKGIIGSGLYSAVGDQHGNILFTSYQGVPCRGYLPRDEQGVWKEGANPTQLLDGTEYGGFSLPMADGAVDESDNEVDPYRCVVPFNATPQAVNPPEGYVFTANNDPGHLTADGDAFNDDWYIGGPWSSVRAHTISRELEKAVSNGGATLDDMERIQGNKDSRLGELFAGYLVGAIERASSLSGGEEHSAPDARLVALYEGDAAAMDEVAVRLTAWADRGYLAASGVETFYETPGEHGVEDSVATMVFNAWLGRAIRGVWNDEPVGDVWLYSGSRMQIRAFRRFLEGRGSDNPGSLASWDEATEESVFFDNYGTPEVETSDEVLLSALADALAFLRGPPAGAGAGGFNTDDMSEWKWGLRHQVRFESLLAEFLGDDPAFGFLADLFAIDTGVLPLAEALPNGDPRKALRWFPRGGDQWCVDAANPGFSGTSFTHTNGPVMRMVMALKDGKVEGRNILPGGQSALIESPHFADQAELWLGNQSSPMRFSPEQVLAGAQGRERFTPSP